MARHVTPFTDPSPASTTIETVAMITTQVGKRERQQVQLEWLRCERYYRTFFVMIVRSIRHRGLRRLIEDDNPRFLRQNLVDRVRKILTALILAEHINGFITDAPPGWRIHRLSGERQNEWSISVSDNWRITFEEEDSYIDRLNLEDYH